MLVVQVQGELVLRQGPVKSSIGRYQDWKYIVICIRRGKEDRIRLLTYYIFSIFSKVGRMILHMQGRYGISNT